MAILEHLEPKAVFAWFEQLCAIPHGSGNTKAVGDWLIAFAEARGLEHHRDGIGNVILIKPAAPGYEAVAPVILQGHMDMVCEQTPDSTLDMAVDGLRLAVADDTVYAEGTTLGGDDGIFVAMALALLDDPSLPHPRLEAVFTVDEEVGMLGAAALDVTPLQGRRMINIDSEVEGILTAGCAGGCLARCTVPLTRAPLPFSGVPMVLTIDGLTGGHSGTEIHRGLANANVLLGRALYTLEQSVELRLVHVAGGMKDNAIPVRAKATLLVRDARQVEALCQSLERTFQAEYALTDPALRLTVEVSHQTEPGTLPMDQSSGHRVIWFLQLAPRGVQAMSADVPGLVQTSLNLGILQSGETSMDACFCVRSSMESQKTLLTDQLRCLTQVLGGQLQVSGDYSAWAYRRESPLRELMTRVFTEQYGKPPVIDVIHAGVECGMFSGKLPELDCVSIGPDLSDIHTPRERMHIASVARTWAFLLETLRQTLEK